MVWNSSIPFVGSADVRALPGQLPWYVVLMHELKEEPHDIGDRALRLVGAPEDHVVSSSTRRIDDVRMRGFTGYRQVCKAWYG